MHLGGKSYSEMYRTDGTARSHYLRYGEWLRHQPGDRLAQKRAEALAEAVFRAVRYKPGASDVQDSAAVALKSGEGVCQDHAHVYVACSRALGMPARGVRQGGGGESMEAAVMVAESAQQQQQ